MYIINYNEQGKILGFTQGKTDLNIEVTNATYIEAQRYNKIIVDGDNITFDKVDWRTEAEILKQAKAEKWININSQIASLKIGYLVGETFVAKFGYEIDGYLSTDTKLYDVSNLPVAEISVDAHVYNGSGEGLRSMIEQAVMLAPETTINWYEDWQTFTTDKVCLDVVAARARIEQQLIRDTIMGV